MSNLASNDQVITAVEFNTEKENPSSKEYDTVEGFSKRFNRLLDLAGFESTGRITKLANFCAVSVSGARRWCKLDRPPRIRDLNKLVESLVALTPHALDVHEISQWLLYGNGNPLEPYLQRRDQAEARKTTAPSSSKLSTLSNHQIMSQVYITLNDEAQKLGFDLYKDDSLANARIDEVIIRLVDYINTNRIDLQTLEHHEGFQRLTSSLLIVAKDSHF